MVNLYTRYIVFKDLIAFILIPKVKKLWGFFFCIDYFDFYTNRCLIPARSSSGFWGKNGLEARVFRAWSYRP